MHNADWKIMYFRYKKWLPTHVVTQSIGINALENAKVQYQLVEIT